MFISRLPRVALTLFLTSCHFSCNLLNKMFIKGIPASDSLSRSAGRKAAAGFADSARQISKNLISGLKGATYTPDPDVKRIMKWLQSIGDLADSVVGKLGDSIDSRLGRMKGEIKDPTVKAYLSKLIGRLGDTAKKKRQYLLSDLVLASLDSLRSPASKKKISSLMAQCIWGFSPARRTDICFSRANAHSRFDIKQSAFHHNRHRNQSHW
jgi:hypothetical protein